MTGGPFPGWRGFVFGLLCLAVMAWGWVRYFYGNG